MRAAVHADIAIEAGLATRADAEEFARSPFVHQVVRALVTEHDLSDSLFAAAEQGLGLTVLFDLISLVGYYQHTALSLRVWRVPVDPDGNPFPDTEATRAAPGH